MFSGRQEDDTECEMRRALSNWSDMTRGVPYRSVLGPLPFQIFVNDVPEWIQSDVRMFSDDTKVWTVIKH